MIRSIVIASSNFAGVVQTVERMRYLVILTVCDIRAVGPDVWNGWKGQLLRNLYQDTELFLSGGFSSIPQKARANQIREELADALVDWTDREKDAILNLPYSAYYLSTDLDTQIHHMNFLRDVEKGLLKVKSCLVCYIALRRMTLLKFI